MHTRSVKTFWTAALLLTGLAGLNAMATAADAPENYQVVDGVAIYLGVMPAQIVQGHPPRSTRKPGCMAVSQSGATAITWWWPCSTTPPASALRTRLIATLLALEIDFRVALAAAFVRRWTVLAYRKFKPPFSLTATVSPALRAVNRTVFGENFGRSTTF